MTIMRIITTIMATKATLMTTKVTIMTTIMMMESIQIDGHERSFGSLQILPWGPSRGSSRGSLAKVPGGAPGDSF